MRYKSRILSVILTAICALSAWADNEVIVNISPRYQVMPPAKYGYLVPGNYFNVSITNPTDEELSVYLAFELKQIEQARIGQEANFQTIYSRTDVDPSAPNNYQPASIMTLPAASTKMLSSFELSTAIAFYPLSSEYIFGLDSYDEATLMKDLLPEGHYEITLTAFRAKGVNGERPALSNPELSKADFWVFYQVEPARFFGPNLENRVLGADEGKNADGTDDKKFRYEFNDCPLFNFRDNNNTFNWERPVVPAQLTGNFIFQYELEMYRLPIGTYTSDLDSYPNLRENNKVMLQSTSEPQYNIMGTFLNVPPQMNLTEFDEGDYYAIRLHSTVVNQKASEAEVGYTVMDNNGYSEWKVVRSTCAPVIPTTGELDGGAIVPIAEADKPIVSVPAITTPELGESGLKRHTIDYKTDKLKVEWKAPELVDYTDKDQKSKAEKAEYAYKLYIFDKGDSDDIDEILKGTPIYKVTGLKETSHEIPFAKEVVEKITAGKSYIIIVTADPTSEYTSEGIIWTGKGKNCYTFAAYNISPQKFESCNKDETNYEFTSPKSITVKEGSEVKVYVGSSVASHAFPMYITKITSTGQKTIEGVSAPIYSGSGYVMWDTGIGGHTVKVAVDFTDIAIDKNDRVMAGSVTSAKMTGTGIDWIPYDAINDAIARVQGFADKGELFTQAIDDISGSIDAAFTAAINAINTGTASAADAANSVINEFSNLSMSSELAQILATVLEYYGGDYFGDLNGVLGDAIGNLNTIDIPSLSSAELSALIKEYSDKAKKGVTDFMDKFQQEVTISPELIKSKCGKYWEYVNGAGKQVGDIATLAGIQDEIIHLPLRVPNNFWAENGSDNSNVLYDLSIMSMELGPDRAQVSALMLANLSDGNSKDMVNVPGTDTKVSPVLAFAAPRLCIYPGQLMPSQGEFGLLYEFGFADKSSGFDFMFQPTTNWEDADGGGCMVHWEDKGGKKAVLMKIDADMTIPNLYKLNSEDCPTLTVGGTADLSGPDAGNWGLWGEFVGDPGSEAGFRFPDCPSLKFISNGALIIDMSEVSNMKKDLKSHPKYDWGKYYDSEEQHMDVVPADWKGLMLEDFEVELPDFIRDNDNNPFRVGVKQLMIDKTGLTMSGTLGAKKGIGGSLDGWSLTLDDLGLDIVHSCFDGCFFEGRIGVPIISKRIKYRCDMSLIPASEVESAAQKTLYTNVSADGKVGMSKDAQPLPAGKKAFNLAFKTTFENDSADVDLGIASIHLANQGTWFEIKYIEGYDTQVELMASGTITIGGAKAANAEGTGSKLGKIPYEIPGIRFTGLRVANFSLKTKRAGDEKSYGQTFIDSYVAQLKKQGTEMWGFGFGRLLSDNNEKYGLSYEEYAQLLADQLINDDPEQNHELQFAGNGFFSYGAWSLASEEKTFFDMPLMLKGINFIKGKTDKQIGVGIEGAIALLKNAAGCDLLGSLKLDVFAEVQLPDLSELTDLSKYKLKFLPPEFGGIGVDGSFAGGMVKVTGDFDVDSETEEGVEASGFRGNVDLTIKELCTINVSAGWYDCVKDKDKFKALYFAAGTDLGKVGVQIGGGVSITSIMGGFYINYALDGATSADYEAITKAIKNPRIKKGAVGGAFGIGLGWGAPGKNVVNGKFGMIVNYDLENDRLGLFRMFGEVKALEDIITANAQIRYENNLPGANGKCPTTYKGNESRYNNCQYFNISITVDASADLDKATEALLGEVPGLDNIAEKFNESCAKITESAKGALGDSFGADKEEKVEGQTESDKKDNKKAEAGLSAKCDVKVNLEFEYRHYRGGEKDKWHVYLGKPAYDDRCRLTFFDIMIGKRPAYIRAYAFADGYFCLGNELPDNGKLPELPSEIAKFLQIGADVKDSSKGSVQTDGNAMSAYEQAKAKTLSEGPGGDANIKFGAQFGARIGCDFDVHAVFAYAKMGGQMGFDFVLKQFADNCMCSDGSKLGGKGGFYAMGQMYAYMYGELGLTLDLGIWRGDWSLARVDLGAMLKGGFPNPAWAYGKVRARAEVLGGLFKVNKTVELKVGRVCVPIVGDPLMSIQIFDDFSSGYGDSNTGWDKERAISCEDVPSVVTSVPINRSIELVDEDRKNALLGGRLDTTPEEEANATASARRIYQFRLVDASFGSPNGQKFSAGLQGIDEYNFKPKAGAGNDANQIHPEERYYAKFVGRAVELRGKYDGSSLDKPLYQEGSGDVQWRHPLRREAGTGKEYIHVFEQDTTVYFRTAQPSDNIAELVRMMTPFDKTNATINEVAAPTVSLGLPFDQKIYDPQFEWAADLEVWNDERKQFEYIDYDPTNPFADSKYGKLRLNYLEEKGKDSQGVPFNFYILSPDPVNANVIQPNTKYRWTFYKLDNVGYQAFVKKAEAQYLNLMQTIALSAQAAAIINESQGLSGTFMSTSENYDVLEGKSDDEKAELASMSSIASDFANYTESTDLELIELAGDESVERRVMKIREDMKNALSQFRTACLQFEVTTGEHRTVKDQLMAYLQGKDDKSKIYYTRTITGLEGKTYTLHGEINNNVNRTSIGAPMVQPIGMQGWSATTIIDMVKANPYYALNFWGGIAMRPLSNQEITENNNRFFSHFFNSGLMDLERELGNTLSFQIGYKTGAFDNANDYEKMDYKLWRNHFTVSNMKKGSSANDYATIYKLGDADKYGKNWEVLQSLFCPMYSNQWIPMRGRLAELDEDVYHILDLDYMMAESVSHMAQDTWRSMTQTGGAFAAANLLWADRDYDFKRDRDAYASLVKNQDTDVQTKEYYDSNGLGYMFSFPSYQLPLIHAMFHRFDLSKRYTVGPSTYQNWPRPVDQNLNFMDDLDKSKMDVLGMAIAILNEEIGNTAIGHLPDNKMPTLLYFNVMRPNAYNCATIGTEFLAGNGGRDETMDIINGRPTMVHNVTVRPSTAHEYQFGLTMKPGRYTNRWNADAGKYDQVRDYSSVENMTESNLVWIPNERLRKLAVKYLNTKFKTTYTDNESLPKALLEVVLEVVDNTKWDTDLNGLELLPNVKKISLRFTPVEHSKQVIRVLDLRKCTNLETLDIDGLTTEKVLLTDLKKLKTVKLTNDHTTTFNWTKGIDYVDITGCEALTELNVKGNNLKSIAGFESAKNLVSLNISGNLFEELDVTMMEMLDPRSSYLGNQFYCPSEEGMTSEQQAVIHNRMWKNARQFIRLAAPSIFEQSYPDAMTMGEMMKFATNYTEPREKNWGFKYASATDRYYEEDVVAHTTYGINTFGVMKRNDTSYSLGALKDSLLINAILNYGISHNLIAPSVASPDEALKLGYAKGTYPYNAYVYHNSLTSLDKDWMQRITELDASGLGITTIEMKSNKLNQAYHLWDLMPNLQKLNISDNALEDLNLSGFHKLASVDAHHNKLLSISISDNAPITDLDLSRNYIALLKLPSACANSIKTLNLSVNSLMDLNLQKYTALKELDCSYNRLYSISAPHSILTKLNISYNPLEFGAGLFDLAVYLATPDNITHLEACGIEQLQEAVLTTWNEVFKMSDCPNLWKVHFPAGKLDNLVHFDVSNCPSLDISKGLAGKAMPKISTFNASGISMPDPLKGVADLGLIVINKDFKVFDIHGNKLSSLSIITASSGTDANTGNLVSNAEARTFAIGDPDRTKGRKINCGFYECEDLLAEWDAVYKWQANNANVNGFAGMATSSSPVETVDVADAQDKRFKEAFPELHDRLWKKYAPNHDFFSPDMAANIPDFEIDASNLNIDLSKALTFFTNTLVSLKADGAVIPTDTLDMRYCAKLKKLSLNGIKLKGNQERCILGGNNKYEASIKNADMSQLAYRVSGGRYEQNNFNEFESLDISYSTVPDSMTLNQKYTQKFECVTAPPMKIYVDNDLNETAVSEGKYRTMIVPDANNKKPIYIYFSTPTAVRTWFSHPECFTCDTVGITFCCEGEWVGELPIYRSSDGAIDVAKMSDHATLMQRFSRRDYYDLVSDLGTDRLLDVNELTISKWNSTSVTLHDYLQMLPQLKKLTITTAFRNTNYVGSTINLEDHADLTDISNAARVELKLPTTFNRASKLSPTSAPINRLERNPGTSHSLTSLDTDMRAAKLAQQGNDNTNVDLPASLTLLADWKAYINSDDCATLTDYAQKWFDSFTYDGCYRQPEINVKARTKTFDFNVTQLETEKIYVEQGSTTPLNFHITEAPYATSVYFETTDDFVNTFNPATYHDNWHYYVRLNKEYPYLGETYFLLSTHDTAGSPSSAGWAKKVVDQTRSDLDKREAERNAEATKRQEREKAIAEKYGSAVSAWVGKHFSDVFEMEKATSLDISGESVDPAVFELLPNLTTIYARGTTFERDGALQDLKVPEKAWSDLVLTDAKMAKLIMPSFAAHAHNGIDIGEVYGDFTNVSCTSAEPKLDGSFANYLVDCYSTQDNSGALILSKFAGTGTIRMIDGAYLNIECIDAPADYSVYLPTDSRSCTVSLSPAGGKIMSIYFQNADQLSAFFGRAAIAPSEWKSAYRMYINTPNGYKELDLEYKGGDFQESLVNQAALLSSTVIPEFISAMEKKLGTSDFSTVTTLDISGMTIHPDINLYNLGFTGVQTLKAVRTKFSDGQNLYCPDLAQLHARSIDLQQAQASDFNKIVNDCFNAIESNLTMILSGCDIKEIHMPGNMVTRRYIMLENTNSLPCKIYVPKSPAADVAPTIGQFHNFKVTGASGNIVEVYFENPVDVKQWISRNYSGKYPNVHLFIETARGYKQVMEVVDPDAALEEAKVLVEANK